MAETARGELARAGEVIGGYRLEAELGRGGMGAVFEAVRLLDGQRVALKTLHGHLADSAELVERLLREAKTASSIASEHVAKVLEVGRLPDGIPYLVMELLEGETLDVYARRHKPLAVTRAVDLVLETCEGLAAAHDAGVVHRDLKPSNLFLARGPEGPPRVKILDFGISKARAHDPSVELPTLTETGVTLGSPQFMSPEQLRSARNVDARSDLFSLGIVLHKLLTSRLPFEAESIGAYAAMIAADPPTPVRSQRPEVPPELEAVVLKCLEKRPERRFSGARSLAAALAPFASEEGKVIAARLAAGEADETPPPSTDVMRVSELPTVPREPTTAMVSTRAAPKSAGLRASLWVAAPLAVGALAALGVFVARGVPAAAPSSALVPTKGTAALPPAPPSPSASSRASAVLRVHAEPANATIELDGVETAASAIELAPTPPTHRLVVRAAGYEPETRDVPADTSAELTVQLHRARRPVSVAPVATGAAVASPPPPAAVAPPPPTATTKPKLKPLMEENL